MTSSFSHRPPNVSYVNPEKKNDFRPCLQETLNINQTNNRMLRPFPQKIWIPLFANRKIAYPAVRSSTQPVAPKQSDPLFHRNKNERKSFHLSISPLHSFPKFQLLHFQPLFTTAHNTTVFVSNMFVCPQFTAVQTTAVVLLDVFLVAFHLVSRAMLKILDPRRRKKGR